MMKEARCQPHPGIAGSARLTARRGARLAGSLRPMVAVLLAMAGCATPIGVHRVEPRDVYRTLTASALTTEEPSAGTAQVLLRLDLAGAWHERPEAVLAELHAGLGGAEEPDRLFALAELSFLLADSDGDPARYLASAVYAYAFLFPADPADAPRATDPRLRLAFDLYNRGLASGLVDPHGAPHALDLRARSVELPFGDLEIAVEPGGFTWAGRPLESFVSVADFAIRGMRNRYREPGIGAPLMATAKAGDDTVAEGREKWISTKRGLVPVTAVLRLDRAAEGLRARRVAGQLALHSMGTPRPWRSRGATSRSSSSRA